MISSFTNILIIRIVYIFYMKKPSKESQKHDD